MSARHRRARREQFAREAAEERVRQHGPQLLKALEACLDWFDSTGADGAPATAARAAIAAARGES